MAKHTGSCTRWRMPLARRSSRLRAALLLLAVLARAAAAAVADSRSSQAVPQPSSGSAGSNPGGSGAARAPCPPPSAPVSAPGCPCTVPSVQQRQQNDGSSAAACNVCPAGFRCSPSAAAHLVSAGWRQELSSVARSPPAYAARSGAGDSTVAGVCVPCQIGEYCAQGTQEETWLSLSTCRIAAPRDSAGAPATEQRGADSLASCHGFKPCPAGAFCPNASIARPCEPGRWCPLGSTASQSCNITNLLAWNPFRLLQPPPQSMLEALASGGLPLMGNACPANASTPLLPCDAGFYCPSPQQRLTCPPGFFCPRNSQAPKRCPALASCSAPGIASPTWSWLGLLLMLLLLVLLLILLEFARLAGRRSSKASTSEDEVAQLISAVGYQIVSTKERRLLRRVAQPQRRPRLSRFKTRLNRAFARQLPGPAADSLGCPGPLGEAHEEHDRPAGGVGDDVMCGGFYDQGAAGHLPESEELSAPLPGLPDAAAATSIAGGGAGQYRISPRVMLVFTSVWVANRSLSRARRLAKARRLMQQGGAPPAGKPSPGDVGAEAAASSDAIASSAASQGARFIVPGVSGSFASAQLHAVMGPSGCGKTSLCKALAGRLPLSRVVGDVAFVCEADGPASTAEPLVLSPTGAKSMIGFVPQFDLLHESLSVRENLVLAARLRLPITQDAHRSKWQRSRDVHTVVEEVAALMALDSVVHQVVGASTSRTLSGGTRKRVAIGVELVAKPCLLVLDEPTSGLDAAVAADVVAALKASALAGMNILAVMHQPRVSIFNTFDTTTLLGSGGHIVYAGPTALTLPYLSFLGFQAPAGENTADFLLDVIAGVVPRPGDPDFMPRQLAALWEAAGAAWIRHAQRHSGAVLAPPALPAGPPDWPWRPRDLEALLGRFNLQAGQQEALAARRARRAGGGHHLHHRHSHNKAHVLGSQLTVVPSLPGRSLLVALVLDGRDSEGGAGGSASGRSVLSYDGFVAFWEEAGLRKWLSKDEYADFLEGVCDDFGMAPGGSITQRQFLDVLKAHLHAAAAAAAAAAGSQQLSSSQLTSEQLTQSPPAAESGARPSLEGAGSVASGSSQHAAASEELPHSCGRRLARINTLAATSVFASFGALPASEASSELPPALSDQVLPQLPSPQGSAPGTAAGSLVSGRLAPLMSVATPGILATPTARLQQHAGWRRSAGTQPSAGGGSTGREAAAAQQQQQQQQAPPTRVHACHSIELAPAGPGRPLQSVPLGLLGGGQAANGALGSSPQRRSLHASCSTLGPRARRSSQERQLGGLARPLQSEPASAGLLDAQQQQLQPTHTLADVAQLIKLQQLQDEAEGVQAGTSTPQHAAGWGRQAHTPLALLPDDDVEAACALAPPPAPTAAAAAPPPSTNAAAVLAGGRLPSRGMQLWLVVVRAGRKWVSSRGALMTDLLLSALLGLALGTAQGNISSPPESVLWLLITLLAYGCMTLARSIQRYGEERHIYLQQESQAGLSVVAWVFGHQLFDVINLFLQPALFFAWLYVMTLPPMSALTYYLVLVAVGWYTSGLGFLISLLFAPRVTLLAGLAVALLLGGVANGVAPRLWQLSGAHPLAWLDQLSYTRWGLQAIYIDWLTPAAAEAAPATAAFLGSMGWCGLQPALLAALQGSGSSAAQQQHTQLHGGGNSTTGAALGRHEWWNMTGAERADAMAGEVAAAYGRSSGDAAAAAAAPAALTQLWQYALRPELLQQQCAKQGAVAFAVLLGLGAGCRLLLLLLVKFKVFRKAQE